MRPSRLDPRFLVLGWMVLGVGVGTLSSPLRSGEVAPRESFRPEQREHWAYQVPQRSEPPRVEASDWVRNPIDQFVLSGMAWPSRIESGRAPVEHPTSGTFSPRATSGTKDFECSPPGRRRAKTLGDGSSDFQPEARPGEPRILQLQPWGMPIDETLVIWGGEFGRTPVSQGGSRGRDHNATGFTMWMAGGGVQGGRILGATDEIGLNVIKEPVHINDLHATSLHLMGLDHKRLTYLHNGREERLTDVGGRVLSKLFA